MKFTRLQIKRFRNIDSFSSSIGDGIVLLKGPNEAGKSSLLSAIIFALFEDPKSSARRLEQAKEWNKESLYQFTLALNTNSETYVLEKDFENKSTLLRNETTSEFWKDKNKVNTKLTEIIGFFSKNVFTSTACVFQEDLHAISSGQKGLRDLLEEKIAGKEDTAVEPILRLLEKKASDLKRGLDRPAHVNPGEIRQTVDELDDLKERRDKIADTVLRLNKARQRVHELSSDVDESIKSLEIKNQALGKSKLYVKARERYENLNRVLQKTLEDLEKLTKAEEEIERLKVKHEVKKKNLKETEANLVHYETATKIKMEKDALELDLQRKKETLNKAAEIVGVVDELKKSLAALPIVSEELVRALLQTESDIRALEKTIGQRAMLLTVTFQTPIPYVIETEDGLLSKGEGTTGETIEGTAKKEIHIHLKDIAEVQVASKDQALEASMKKLKHKKQHLKNQLKQHQCESVTKLADMKERRETSDRNLEAKENELKIILRKETVESLEKEVCELKKRLDQIKKDFDDTTDFAISEGELKKQEREVQRLRKEVLDLDGSIRENQGILKTFSKEQLEKEKRDQAREILVAETALDDLKGFEASGEEVIKKENEVKVMEQKLYKLKVERETLEHILREDHYGQEHVAELEERIETLERRVVKLRMRLRAYEIIKDVLDRSRGNILENISSEVDKKIGRYFGLITGGKYDQVRLSREDFSLLVFSAEKGDWINPDTEELSSGAKDQLYLAARLALVDAVCGEDSIPLVLDDPLVHFDASRRENTRNLLQEVSKKHQVLIFSCHDYCDDWANQVISL
ncbi:MAG: AAA family ATPase [Desulfobacteraceae bacterium]|nr:MAG: AAA family ATPase [Desulfobacteraceae bacterium]